MCALQIPNFLLAAPTLIITLCGCYQYVKCQPVVFLTGGLLANEQYQTGSHPALSWLRWSKHRPGQTQQSAGQTQRSGGQFAESAGQTVQSGGQLLFVSQGGQQSSRSADAASTTARQWQPHATARSAAEGSVGAISTADSTMGSNGDGAVARADHNTNEHAYKDRREGACSTHLQRRNIVPGQLDSSSAGQSFATAAKASCTAGFYSPNTAVYIYHWAVMGLVAACIMHVQVSTRFLSSCLPWYWFTADVLTSNRACSKHWYIWLYCFAYMVLGAVLFPNFYPWT